TRAVPPFAGWLAGYQRAVYLRGTLLAAVLAVGLAGIARRCRGTRRGGDWGGPGLYPWLAAATVLVVPVLTADYSERYVLIPVPSAASDTGTRITTAVISGLNAAAIPPPARTRATISHAPPCPPPCSTAASSSSPAP